ncbi:MAG: hypothetical protein RL490_1371 [Pseudomonadota bacterium]|jgi:hypothetical protein
MFHSSVVPVALPLSLVIGIIFYSIFNSLGSDPVTSVAAAKTMLSITNVLVGIPKNLIVGDILSLLFVRPLSLVAGLSIIGAMVGA